MNGRGLRALAGMAVALIGGIATAGTASASTFDVTSLADSGPGTLREAIIRANDEATNPGADAIRFTVTGTLSLTSALPPITSPMTIDGTGAGQLTVRRSPGAPGFRLLQSTAGQALVVRDLTLTGGRPSTPTDGFGGAITSEGPLTIERSVIADNLVESTQNAFGGGIYADAGITIRDSLITRNEAKGDTGDFGGGVYAPSGSVTVERTTIAGNVGGPAITTFGPTTITNSTVSDNSVGFFAYGTAPVIASSTIVGNGVDNLVAVNASTDIQLKNSIIADVDTGPNCTAANAGASFVSGGHNISNDASCGLNPASADQPNVNPQLLPLTANGGIPTTHALAPGSPAIDAGASGGLITDERGALRPYDDPAVRNAAGGDGADIGAFEVQQPPPQLTVSAKPKQSLKKPIKVTASCVLACRVDATATVKGKGKGKGKGLKKRALNPATAEVVGGGEVVLRLAAPKGVKRKLMKLKRAGRKAKATVSVTATDAIGQAKTATPLKITLR